MSTTQKLAFSDNDASSVDPGWVAPTKAALRKLSLFGDNWDSYGAPRIDPAILTSALTLLWDVMQSNSPAPSVVPTSRGGVQLEWHLNGIDLELEFLTPTCSRAIFEDHRTGAGWEAKVVSELSQLTQAIALLSRP